jgi:hypothetical protein
MKVLAIIGSAVCWKTDLDNLKAITSVFDVMSIGASCLYMGEVKYFATYHFADIPIYKMRRKIGYGNLDYKVIGHKKDKPEIDIIEPHKEPSGSSSLLGVVAAIRLGYKKIILCGCPLEGENKNGITPYNTFQKGWVARLLEIQDYVKSMSGWTADLLGVPSKEWINDIESDLSKI